MVILVTGASVGFGAAIARKFAKENHKVIALARREDKLKELQNELGSDKCQIIAVDICDTKAVKNAIDNLRDDFKNIDVLVNNAGLALGLSRAYETDINDWERMIEVNILSLVRLTRMLLPKMVENKSGHIINIGSIAGTYPYPGGNIYGATKAFVKQFSLNLRADLYDKSVRVTNIEPGLCGGSEFSFVRFKGDKNMVDELYRDANPIMPEDIAEAVFWVATQPKHVNINRIEMMPTTQASSALNVYKHK
ncbi:NAD(P)-dependent oxidoreductase [Helicobacter sp. 16-1353]|nr:NAD(P)-dependent oxidoreductase [Helicobacter sp. 16-1353]